MKSVRVIPVTKVRKGDIFLVTIDHKDMPLNKIKDYDETIKSLLKQTLPEGIKIVIVDKNVGINIIAPRESYES
jgi:hypothetical protein